jgi:outer membrane protein OmpA-like peptidoglycan-associated protein
MSRLAEKKKDFFWLSYADLMTSLFFVMLVLFVLVYTMQSTMIAELDAKNKELKAAKEELDKINEIKKSLENIDSTYFVYSKEYKKHILNIKVGFQTNSSSMLDMNETTRIQIRDAGSALKQLMNTLPTADNVKYLIVIEGQASRDGAAINDELSYKRAIALRNFWFGWNPNLNSVLPNCEVVIAGSGQYGVPREQPDNPPKNQRFLITIIPKIGELKKK